VTAVPATVEAPAASAAVSPVIEAIPADRNPAAVYLARLAPGGRPAMTRRLDTIARLLAGPAASAATFPWCQVRYQHTQAVRAALAERFAPAGANQALAALRGVLREAWRLGHVTAEDHRRAVDIANVRGVTLPAGRAVTRGEVAALFAVCAADPTAAGARDAAVLALGYGGGLRRAEIVALDLDDVDTATGEIRVLHGKGGRQRTAWLPAGAAAAVADWVTVRGDAPGPLITPVDQRGVVTVRRITGRSVLDRLRRRARDARVDAVTMHDFRRTWVGDLLDAGADIATVQQLAGHASPTTTARYDRRPDVARRAAVGKLHVPYVPRTTS